jgi:ubiquinone/menaquinone biosynthesis C-methylase UbiE
MRSEEIQREHYAQSATNYDKQLGQSPEHELALYILLGFIDSIAATSLLDVGAGTGRGLKFLMKHRSNLTLHGIEPVEQLRSVAHGNGIPKGLLTAGDGYQISFPDDSFDIVSEFGVLHHVARPELVVREMLRVARYGIFLSDTNNLGQGRFIGRLTKNLFYWLGLWKLLTFIRTRGRGFVYESNDGLWYYYTLFSHVRELKQKCQSVHIINTRRASSTHWFSASHAAIFATKAAVIDRSNLYAYLK